MDHLRALKILCVCLSCVGLTLPTSVLEAAQPMAGATRQGATRQVGNLVSDVELDSQGFLHGRVVNLQGVPVAGAPVVLRQMDRELAHACTDALGRFRIGPVRGGTYPLWVGRHAILVRAWTANTAPPAATNVALITVGGDLIRGQMPLEEFFASDAVILVAMVAAMIAIPIAVHNSRPSSP